MAACDVYMNYPGFSSETAGSQPGYYGGATSSMQEEMMFTPLRRGSRSVMGESRSIGGSTSDLSTASSRRAEMLQEYFKSTNALNRSIMLEKTSVEKEHTHWSMLSDSRRDEIVDQHFVPDDVRVQYEGGLIGGPAYAWNTRSLDFSQSQTTLDDWDTAESIDGVSMQPLSQPIDVKRKAKSVKDGAKLTPAVTPQMFVRNKLRSFSSRSKKGMRLTKSNSPVGDGTVMANEIIPLFERDVHELDDDIDMPDDSLLRDHIEDQETDPSFARLKPLRYSFGRKLRHKVDHASNSDISTNGYIIYNQDINSLSLQDLSLDDNLRASSPDMAIINTSPEPDRDVMPDSRTQATSPPSVVSEDLSCVSPSRQSMTTPDPTAQNPRCKSRNLESPIKHPLIRSTRAGSSYMTVTSQFADRRQQLKASSVRRKVNSTMQTDEAMPTSVSPLGESQKMTTPPTVVVPTSGKVGSSSDGMTTDSTASLDPLSPLNSPPPSPAGPNHHHRTNRESGYMSSTYQSDDEETIQKPAQQRSRRHSRQTMVNPRH